MAEIAATAATAKPTNYTVTLSIEDEDVAKLNEAGFQLCFACGVGHKTEEFTVVAMATVVSNNVVITWADEYFMAATRDEYNAGVKFTVANNTTAISFKEQYVLPKNWTTGKVSEDPNGKDGEFTFHNETTGDASAVVFLKVKGVPTPIYITPNFVLSDGSEVLKPKKEIALWVQKDVETGLMISKNSSKLKSFSMTGRSSMKAKWNGKVFEESS